MNEIEYNGKKIQYQIKKSKIKNLYIQIKEGKVIVKAPIKMPENYIKQFINKKSKWIYENLKKSEKQMKENIENKNEIKPEEIKKLQKIVEKYIQKYSQLIGINPKKVTIKKIKYAWGSCSSKQNISINMQLAKKEEKIVEYVVLHEMSHLKYMNHSKEFWKIVEKYMPNYKEYRKKLNS